jgi:hypothetical protein
MEFGDLDVFGSRWIVPPGISLLLQLQAVRCQVTSPRRLAQKLNLVSTMEYLTQDQVDQVCIWFLVLVHHCSRQSQFHKDG